MARTWDPTALTESTRPELRFEVAEDVTRNETFLTSQAVVSKQAGQLSSSVRQFTPASNTVR